MSASSPASPASPASSPAPRIVSESKMSILFDLLDDLEKLYIRDEKYKTPDPSAFEAAFPVIARELNSFLETIEKTLELVIIQEDLPTVTKFVQYFPKTAASRQTQIEDSFAEDASSLEVRAKKLMAMSQFIEKKRQQEKTKRIKALEQEVSSKTVTVKVSERSPPFVERVSKSDASTPKKMIMDVTGKPLKLVDWVPKSAGNVVVADESSVQLKSDESSSTPKTVTVKISERSPPFVERVSKSDASTPKKMIMDVTGKPLKLVDWVPKSAGNVVVADESSVQLKSDESSSTPKTVTVKISERSPPFVERASVSEPVVEDDKELLEEKYRKLQKEILHCEKVTAECNLICTAASGLGHLLDREQFEVAFHGVLDTRKDTLHRLTKLYDLEKSMLKQHPMLSEISK